MLKNHGLEKLKVVLCEQTIKHKKITQRMEGDICKLHRQRGLESRIEEEGL